MISVKLVLITEGFNQMLVIEYENLVIEIEKKILKVIRDMRQINPTDKESGGILMGSIISKGNSVVLRDYTVPLKGDCQTRYRFYRRKKRHNAVLENKWKESNKTIMYLGEWHTHPENEPDYSNQDLRNWKRIMRKSKTTSTYLFFIIGGITTYKVWVGNRNDNKIMLVYKGAYDGEK